VSTTQRLRPVPAQPARSPVAPATRAAGVATVSRAVAEAPAPASHADGLGRSLARAVAERVAHPATTDAPLLQRLAQIDLKKPRAIIKDKVFLTHAARKHIFDRHAPPAEADAGEFSQTLWDDPTELYTKMASAIGAGGGTVDPARQTILYEESYAAPIGLNIARTASSRLRVITTLKGMVVTAFPV
jgi:hypothetical protein